MILKGMSYTLMHRTCSSYFVFCNFWEEGSERRAWCSLCESWHRGRNQVIIVGKEETFSPLRCKPSSGKPVDKEGGQKGSSKDVTDLHMLKKKASCKNMEQCLSWVVNVFYQMAEVSFIERRQQEGCQSWLYGKDTDEVCSIMSHFVVEAKQKNGEHYCKISNIGAPK